MARRLVQGLICLMLINACTSNEVLTDIPFSTATPHPVETRPAMQTFDGIDIPSGFAGGDPVVLGSPGVFSFDISGEFNAQISGGTAVYTFLPGSGLLPARNQLYLAASDSAASQQLTFEFLPDIQPGQYALLSPEDFVVGGVSASYARLAFDGSSTRIQPFTENISGMLTLSQVGAAVSGAFQLTAEYVETSSAGEIDVQTIEIVGRFEDIPYQVALEDPFEISVPLPTRNFVSGTQQP